MLNVGPYWVIIPNNDVQTSKSLQDITQNQWPMKYKSQWPTIILRSNLGSYWFLIPNNDVHASNSLQDTRQNHWTIKYRSQWPTFIFRSNIGSYWFIINYDVHTWNSLQNIGKITGLGNIGHADLHFMTHKSMSQDWSMSDQLNKLFP